MAVGLVVAGKFGPQSRGFATNAGVGSRIERLTLPIDFDADDVVLDAFAASD